MDGLRASGGYIGLAATRDSPAALLLSTFIFYPPFFNTHIPPFAIVTMLTIAFVMSALSLAAFASPSPLDVDRRDAISIALTKRDSPLSDSDLDLVDPLALIAGLLRTFL